jgi:hypothetical protein
MENDARLSIYSTAFLQAKRTAFASILGFDAIFLRFGEQIESSESFHCLSQNVADRPASTQ